MNEQIQCARNLLLVDDDAVFLKRLGLSMEKRGFTVGLAENLAGLKEILAGPVEYCYAVVDLKLAQENGLEAITLIREKNPTCRIAVLTGFGNIASAVSAIKAGAVDYLSKPVSAEIIENVLLSAGEKSLPPPPENPMSADRVRWEHISRVYEQCGHNVSETARRLGMHRRTLQRILSKRAPADTAVGE